MFQTGVLKCCLPMAITYLAQLAPSEGVAQEKLAQIAGGLLLYTWAFGCLAPIQDKIKALVLPGAGHAVEGSE